MKKKIVISVVSTVALILIALVIFLLVTKHFSNGEEQHKVHVVYKNGSWNNESINDSYAAGEIVTIKLEAITEQYYKVYVNGKEQPVSSSNLDFVYYYFKMPSDDVTVEIEEHWVEIPSSLGTIFSEYLDSINFTERLSQGDLLDILEKYSYNGKTITDEMDIAFEDGMYGGGMSGGGKLFGFENDYTETQDYQYANYSNKFYTSVKLDGFSLPHGVKFEYTLDNVLQNLKPYLNLPDDLNQENIILYSDDKSVLELTNFLVTSENEPNYSYELKYTEIYKITLNDGREDNVTRCVSMRFTNGDNKLGLFTVYVNENYKTKK